MIQIEGRDALNGAPLEMTDADGSVRWSEDYSSFGAVNGQTQDSEGFRNGKPVESQPLRYYDPIVGRFTTQDPIGLADGENLYAYRRIPME
ncbi:RHS repeat domain-containing protein [Pectobacterium brasiliense]|uniref:RHS repeat domain-containing protein n=1 Tax=Pectobacterium brasiliense TaxID=180957 RepID=UPI003BAFCB54